MTAGTPATTPTGVDETLAQQLRDRLADGLTTTGDLRTPAWRDAVRSVPRHLFLPRFYTRQDTDQATLWTPVTRDTIGDDAWLAKVYENTTWTTQLDGTNTSSDTTDPQSGTPTSSSTLPGLLIMMLEHLNTHPGDRLLIVGTGTGYSTALASAHLGADAVTSVDVDPALAADARRRLAQVGYTPTVVHGNGLDGHQPQAPYDRVIAFCSVTSIPPAWIDQTRPGAVIVATLTGALGAYGLAKLITCHDGSATGHFLPDPASFMLARSQTNPEPAGLKERLAPSHGTPRPARLAHGILDDESFGFTAQFAVPHVMRFTTRDIDTTYTYLAHHDDGSWARLHHDGTAHLVEQGGHRALWDEIETLHDTWHGAGSPPPHAYTLTIEPSGNQHITHPHAPLRYTLPAPS